MAEMSIEEFTRRYVAIESTHDRDLARLFVESGWTQERIAEQIGKEQSWVSRHLCFGRFLNFMPTGITLRQDLTERQFRRYWDATNQELSEQDRFQSMCRALGIAPPAVVDDITVAVNEFSRKTGYGLDSGNSSRVKALFVKGTEHIRQMVGTGEGKIGLEKAYHFVRNHSVEEQNKATIVDVKNYKFRDRSKEAIRARAKKKPKKPKPVPTPPVQRAPLTNFTKLDIGTERIHGQPVRLFPVHVQRMQEAQIRANGIITMVTRIGTDPSFTVEQFWKDVELLLAYQPVPGKKNGEEINYGKRIQASLQQFELHIEAAATRLCALRDSITERSVKQQEVVNTHCTVV